MQQSRTGIASCLAALFLAGQAFALGPADRAEIAEARAEALEKNAAKDSPTPPAPSALITQPGARAVDPAGEAPLDDALTCLSRAIYWEAKGEGTAGMAAVANVVINRLSHEAFPATVCKVVTQGSEQGNCQFSWWCDGRSDQVQEEAAYMAAKEIARQALNRQLADRTHGALYFHHRQVSPSWAEDFTKTFETGEHVFYKPHDAN